MTKKTLLCREVDVCTGLSIFIGPTGLRVLLVLVLVLLLVGTPTSPVFTLEVFERSLFLLGALNV